MLLARRMSREELALLTAGKSVYARNDGVLYFAMTGHMDGILTESMESTDMRVEFRWKGRNTKLLLIREGHYLGCDIPEVHMRWYSTDILEIVNIVENLSGSSVLTNDEQWDLLRNK